MKLFRASAHCRNTKKNFLCFCTLQKHQMKLFHASARDRKAKKKNFMLLHTAERPKRSFSCFCTLQKDQKEDFHASAHCRKAKKKFFMLLHTAERPKRRFPRLAKVVSRMVWHFRAWRKSFPKRFGISAPGESYFRDNLLKIVTINIHK